MNEEVALLPHLHGAKIILITIWISIWIAIWIAIQKMYSFTRTFIVQYNKVHHIVFIVQSLLHRNPPTGN